MLNDATTGLSTFKICVMFVQSMRLCLFCLLLPALSFAQTVNLTFRVDMQYETISPLGVHIAGDFQAPAGVGSNWNPAATLMSDADSDKVYELSVQVPPGTYSYKFVNGNAWGSDENPPVECSVGATNNRIVTVGTGGASLPPVAFNSCNPTVLDTNYAVHWWNDAVFYEIFVRSFYDSNGDGIGDFRGIIEKLDYLNDGDPNTDTDLGITGIWLMPMMASPSYHGYDVTNYYQTEPDYGSMADFEALLDAAHDRGIKVIIDFVMNHTSNQHPWFTQSANNQNGFRDWYIWSDNNPGFFGPWGQTVWQPYGSDYYYGLFWSGMPDLNYSHPPVKTEMFNITRFWLDKGVDGFRLDAIKYLDENGTVLENTPETFQLLEDFNDVYKAENPEAVTVGEVWSNTTSILPYIQNERLDICFEFDLATSIISATKAGNPQAVRQQLGVIQQSYTQLQYATFLTNHDIDRIFSQFSSNTAHMKQAAALYLSMPGVPFIYYGEEIGLVGVGADENKRRPMQWTGGLHAGFSTQTPWISVGGNLLTNNVATMSNNPASLLSHYKKLVQLRNRHAALRRGYLLNAPSNNPNVLAYARIYEQECILVCSNFEANAVGLTASLPASTLSAGDYTVTDLFTNQALGSLSINSSGGFSNWQIPGDLGSRDTRMLWLSPKPSALRPEPSNEVLTLAVSPNPVSDEAHVRIVNAGTEIASLEVLDVSGRLVYQGSMAGGQVVLSTGHWEPGVYFVRVTVDGRAGSVRLVKPD